jgi:two-component system OmpR family response regulator
MSIRILLVEDDRELRATLRSALEVEGYRITACASLADARALLAHADTDDAIDVVLLDLGLPDGDGQALLAALRRDHGTPVLVISAREGDGSKIRLLDAGADDYLVKPFSFAELLARLRALTRRAQPERPTVLQAGSLRLDPATRQVWRGEAAIELSAKEFTLLETFMRRPGQVLSRRELLGHAWDTGYNGRSNVVDVYVGYLRAKIDHPFGYSSIETVRGAGYRLCPDRGA